jgi:hypothetical protein
LAPAALLAVSIGAELGRGEDNYYPVDDWRPSRMRAPAQVRPPELRAPAVTPRLDSPRAVAEKAVLDLAARLVALKRRHAELLVDRTELHPEVQDLARRIDETEARLKSVARELSPPRPEPQPPRVEEVQPPAPVLETASPRPREAVREVTERRDAAREFRRNRTEFDRAAEELDRALAAPPEPPKVALPAPSADPAPSVPTALEPEPPRVLLPESTGASQLILPPELERELAAKRRPTPWPWLPIVMGGFALVGGTGLLAVGLRIDTPLTDESDADEVLPTPIVAEVPDPDGARHSPAGLARLPRIAWFTGAALLAVAGIAVIAMTVSQ